MQGIFLMSNSELVNIANMLSSCMWGEILHQSWADSVHWISTSDVLASTFVTHTTGVLRGVFCDAQKQCIYKNLGVHFRISK